MTAKGILNYVKLPNQDFADQWDKIIVADEIKTRLLSLTLLEFTVRGRVSPTSLPLHGIILLVGPPGTGKTSLARGLANRVAESINGADFHFIEVEPHALASAALGRSQKAVRDLLQKTVAEYANQGPLIVLLDEVETLAPERRRMSLEANPIDVHRASDAVLASVDYLASKYHHILFIATSNFSEAIDRAFISRADLVEFIDKPDKAACREILKDSLSALAAQWPEVQRLLKGNDFERAAEMCVGLDGREIRKAVLGACTFSKDVALNPNLVQETDLIQSIEHQRKERK
ncbi:MAG: AAA family ATPase [Elusimicrobia bacterium]|nr:AAA family ATPase [Elusimicrobiota bacterium]